MKGERLFRAVGAAPGGVRLAAAGGGVAGGVDRELRIVRGVSVITRGEALGHGEWVDETTLDQVVKLGRARGAAGIKSRFTHPGLSSDGLGKALGRVKNFARDGDQVRGDLFLLKSASETPEGDLAGYVMDLAEESPDLFGLSIVFEPDLGEMRRHRDKHSDKDGVFTSPDAGNTKNLMHVRVAALRAADAVDEPAANAGGLYSAWAGGGGNGLPAEAEGVLAYALGLTATAPEGMEVLEGVHPDRLKGFVAGFCERWGVEVKRKTGGASAAPPDPLASPFGETGLESADAGEDASDGAVPGRKRGGGEFGAGDGDEAAGGDSAGAENEREKARARQAKKAELADTLTEVLR